MNTDTHTATPPIRIVRATEVLGDALPGSLPPTNEMIMPPDRTIANDSQTHRPGRSCCTRHLANDSDSRYTINRSAAGRST